MYRYLKVGEIIQAGDELTATVNRTFYSSVSDADFLNTNTKKYGWTCCTSSIGSKVEEFDNLLYRRKIVPEVKYYRTDNGHYVKRYPDNTMDFFDTIDGRNICSVNWTAGDHVAVEEGRYTEISKEEYGVGIAVSQVGQKQNKETVMTHNIFEIDTNRPIGKTVQAVKTYGFKAANYFVFEPAVNIGKPLLKSIRYILFVGGITAGIYSFNNPELVSNTLKSCLPKVSIQAPDILQ